jgi:DNA-binding XRE family transcriptional regulator
VPLAKDIQPPFSGMGVPVTVRAGDALRALLNLGLVAPCIFLAAWAKHHEINQSLGEKLKQIRAALGLSQREMAEQLAARTGFTITQTHVSNYERDRVEPFLETTLAYARLANVEMNEIADDDVDLSL